MYRIWHEPMLASMGMPKAILYYILYYYINTSNHLKKTCSVK